MIHNILKNKLELFRYAISGFGATTINIVSFGLFRGWLSIPLIPSNVLAWVLAFIFAYITNKLFVFESRDKETAYVIKEFSAFFLTRISTLLLDTILIWCFVDILAINQLISKVLDNIVIIAANYFLAKFYVFRQH